MAATKRAPRERDPVTGAVIVKNPAKPRPVYIVYDTDNAVQDGKFNKASILISTRSAKEALEFIDTNGNGRALSYFSIMSK